MEITFLGTGCMIPTSERNQMSFFLKYGSEGILFDCGEGTQRQFRKSDLKPTRITKILISHWHGDHVLGLPGLMDTLCASEYNKRLEIYGPKGIKKQFEYLRKAMGSKKEVDMEIKEMDDEEVIEFKDFYIKAFELRHSNVNALGYSFIEKDKNKIDMEKLRKEGVPSGPHIAKLQEGEDINYKGKRIKSKDYTYLKKGKKLSYISDTVYFKGIERNVSDSDLLVSESTFSDEEKDKASEYEHLTAGEAAEIASKSGCENLVLTHFSQRYENGEKLKKEAKKVFENTKVSYDFMRINLDY